MEEQKEISHLNYNLYRRFRNMSTRYPWYYRTPLLHFLVELWMHINWNYLGKWCYNIGRFKEGDIVRYNWMAKIRLHGLAGLNRAYTVNATSTFWTDLKERGGPASLWLRRNYFWESGPKPMKPIIRCHPSDYKGDGTWAHYMVYYIKNEYREWEQIGTSYVDKDGIFQKSISLEKFCIKNDLDFGKN